jgi:phosphatidylglycerol:prolipoprotein diacylglycerol transferase
MRNCRRFGITPEELTDALLIGAPAGIVGARLYYVIFHYDSFAG